MSVHRTAGGKYLDINALKIQQERTIAVGNSRQNARGDIIGPGGIIAKTRDEIMREHYESQKGSVLSDGPVYDNIEHANQLAVADVLTTNISDPSADVIENKENTEVIDPKTGAPTSGGYADALARSQELANKLRNQRNRI